MMSGAVPAAIWVPMSASNSFEPTYWIVMPVACSNAFLDSWNFTASSSTKGPVMLTLVPFILPL